MCIRHNARACAHDEVGGVVENASCGYVDPFFCGDQCEFKREVSYGEAKDWL